MSDRRPNKAGDICYKGVGHLLKIPGTIIEGFNRCHIATRHEGWIDHPTRETSYRGMGYRIVHVPHQPQPTISIGEI